MGRKRKEVVSEGVSDGRLVISELGSMVLYEKFKDTFRSRVRNFIKTLLVQVSDRELAEKVWESFISRVQIDFCEMDEYGRLVVDEAGLAEHGLGVGDVLMLIGFRALCSDAIFKGTVVHEFMHYIFYLERSGVIDYSELISLLRGIVDVGFNCLMLLCRDEEYIVNILEGLVSQALSPSYLQEGEAWVMRGDIIEGGYVYMSGVGFIEQMEVFKEAKGDGS